MTISDTGDVTISVIEAVFYGLNFLCAVAGAAWLGADELAKARTTGQAASALLLSLLAAVVLMFMGSILVALLLILFPYMAFIEWANRGARA